MTDPLLAFRADFPILERSTYLVSNSLGAMPRAAAERLAEYADTWAREGVRAWAREWWQMPVTVGDEIAPLIGAQPGTVAMVPNVSLAHAAIISSLSYAPPRDTIVMTALDFPSVRYVVQEMAARFGARVVVVPTHDGITIDADELIHTIDERTRLVAISHVLFRSAYIVEVERVCAHARTMGALVALDAFHSVGVMPVDVHRIGAHWLAGGVLKWLCGGPGGCFLWSSDEVRDAFAPSLTGWQAHERPFAFEPEMAYTRGAMRWLNGTPVIPALYAAVEGPRILRRAGIELVREKSTRQTQRLIELADERGYRVNAPRDDARRGGTVAIDMPNAYEVAQVLLDRDIMIDYRPEAGIRVAPHFYTSDDEIDRAIGAIDAALASGEWRRFAGRRAVVT